MNLRIKEILFPAAYALAFCLFLIIYLCRKFYAYYKWIRGSTNTNQPWSVYLHDQTSTADLRGSSTELEEEVVVINVDSLLTDMISRNSKDGDGGGNDNLSPVQCIICFSGSEDDPLWMVLRDCKHTFHYNCMHKWLNEDRSCPVCRNYVPPRHEW